MSKIVYFDPIGGVSGDMFVAAFLDASIISIDELQKTVDLVVPEINLTVEEEFRCSLKGTRFHVTSKAGEEQPSQMHLTHHHHGEHHPYKEIVALIRNSSLDQTIKKLSLAIFETLAKAEGKIHGKSMNEISFHEVGRNDAIADIVCASYCVNKVANSEIICGPIRIGEGIITFSHGTMPVPAPATLEILKGIPTIPGYPVGEMTTPTGAAIIATCCNTFRSWTNVIPQVIGYGHGSRNPKGYPSSFRIIAGDTFEQPSKDLNFILTKSTK